MTHRTGQYRITSFLGEEVYAFVYNEYLHILTGGGA